MYIYVYIYTNIYIYMCVYIYMCIYIYILCSSHSLTLHSLRIHHRLASCRNVSLFRVLLVRFVPTCVASRASHVSCVTSYVR